MQPSPHARRSPVVCFVDDEAGIRHITNRLLRTRGFDVLTASSVSDAERVLGDYEGEVDALLMDVHLPDGWGSVAAQRLKAARPGMAVVYTTGLPARNSSSISSSPYGVKW